MCGIFGYNGDHKVEKTFFKLMKHRGPDAIGLKKSLEWTLGHLRLSIIDLGVAANQPFEKDGSILVFNGEIYNYLELKKKYLFNCEFETSSDTEVLLLLLNKFGIKILNEINGMFVFAYLNQNNDLYIVRDRFGVKPIYYSVVENTFYFSSEIKPLIVIKKNIKLDEKIIESYATDTATDYDMKSGYEDIFLIKPAHYLLIKNKKIQNQTQWYFGLNKIKKYGDKNELLKECEDLLLNSIKIRCRADVPVALTLSGGVDSTVIYTLIKEKLNLNIQPFIFKHLNKQTDESILASNLAKKYGDQPIIITQSPPSIENLKKVMWHLELPMWSPSALAYFTMYQEIAKLGYKVVLEGHGSDEQLGGYPYMISSSAIEALKNKNFKDYIIRLKVLLQTTHKGLEQKKIFNLFKFFLSHLKQILIKKNNNFNKVLHNSFDYKILPMVLRTFDRLSMANSLESRMPFMDYRFVEFSRNLPTNMKVSEIGSKSILRKILKKYGNEEIYLNKSKIGFGSDIPALFADKEFKDYIDKLVSKFDCKNSYLNKDFANSMLKKNISWKNFEYIWKVASIAYYADKKNWVNNV